VFRFSFPGFPWTKDDDDGKKTRERTKQRGEGRQAEHEQSLNFEKDSVSPIPPKGAFQFHHIRGRVYIDREGGAVRFLIALPSAALLSDALLSSHAF
jgi:hypothetical protein